jgi:hypothetical protein
MPLWGKSTADESKPKWLDRVNKNGLLEDCFATEQGWVLRHYKGADKATARYWDEVLVAIGGLGGDGASDLLAAGDITAVFFEQEALAQTDTGTVVVIYNEQVDVTGSPTLDVTGTVTGAVTATYARGTGTNRLEFDFTVPSATETLSIGAQTINLAGGTIFDKGSSDASDLAFVAGDVVGAGGSGTDYTLAIA